MLVCLGSRAGGLSASCALFGVGIAGEPNCCDGRESGTCTLFGRRYAVVVFSSARRTLVRTLLTLVSKEWRLPYEYLRSSSTDAALSHCKSAGVVSSARGTLLLQSTK